jgi:hypothetical protein
VLVLWALQFMALSRATGTSATPALQEGAARVAPSAAAMLAAFQPITAEALWVYSTYHA